MKVTGGWRAVVNPRIKISILLLDVATERFVSYPLSLNNLIRLVYLIYYICI